MQELSLFLAPVLEMLAGKYGLAAQILGYMAGLRIVFKPLMTLGEAFVLYTPSKSDNEKLEKFKASKVYYWISFTVDFFASVKLPKPVKK